MSASRARFELALERLRSSDWRPFEELSSAFLVSEYPGLRTMASPAGDGGRDATLFCSEGDERTAIQFSVQQDWAAKINSTVRRLKSTFPDTNVLIFTSNQIIGAEADALRRRLSKEGIFLDVLDRSWFLERMSTDGNRSQAAETLCKLIVDPIFASNGLLKNSSAQSLNKEEAQVALNFLEMQQQDEVTGKNLTRSCFEALVKAALRDTNAEKRVNDIFIVDRVAEFLPQHPKERLRPYVQAALKRLIKGAVKYHSAAAEYHLSYEEQISVQEKSAKLILMRDAFDQDVIRIVSAAGAVAVSDLSAMVSAIREIVETYFLQRGESFAQALASDFMLPMVEGELKTIVIQKMPKTTLKGKDHISFGLYVVQELFSAPSDTTMQYLKQLSDSYTLMSFLSETPDVQSVTKKMFSHGDIWLDTSVLLPVFAEQALSSDERPFTDMFNQARSSGISLFVTSGILHEISSHVNLCFSYARNSNWKGGVPYIYAQYLLSGRRKDKFGAWIDGIVGRLNPSEDIAEYLRESFGILVEPPSDTSELPEAIVEAVHEYWLGVHLKRRGGPDNISVMQDQLARHDAENCLSVIAQRQREIGRSPLGYSSWWLTLDGAASKICTAPSLDRDVRLFIKHSPVMTIDFLFKYLSFGPSRDQISNVSKKAGRIFSSDIIDVVPQELIAVAEKVRTDNEGLDDRLVRRRIREAIEREKSKPGILHQAGLDEINSSLTKHFY